MRNLPFVESIYATRYAFSVKIN